MIRLGLDDLLPRIFCDECSGVIEADGGRDGFSKMFAAGGGVLFAHRERCIDRMERRLGDELRPGEYHVSRFLYLLATVHGIDWEAERETATVLGGPCG